MADAPGVTAQQARAALEEAGRRAVQVRRSDLQLCWMLQVLAGAYMAVAIVFSSASHRGAGFPALVVVAILASIPVVGVVIALRIRAYTHTALQTFVITAIVFNVWNAAIAAVSIGTRFWATGQPSYHFGISALIAVIPLLVGAAIIWRRAS